MESTSSASTRFGLNLFNTITAKQPENNAFLSPFSLSMALSMTQIGANGETALAIMKTLCWEDGKEAAIHEENKKYLALLQQPKEAYKLSVANRLFVEQGYPLLPEFLQQTRDQYLAEAVSSQFKSNPEQERIRINAWVSEQTQDKIKELLASGTVDPLTRMVLVNAIYFKGLWENQFKVSNTKPRPFKVSAAKTTNVPTMMAETSYSFWLDDGTEGMSVLELPYQRGELGLVILLPTAEFGLKSIEEALSLEKLNSIFAKMNRPEKIKLFLPKFEMTCSYSMKEPLCELGMSAAFDLSKADFSRMTGGRDLFVSAVVHKAFVKVDEEGSEAAAATAVVMKRRCLPVMMNPIPEFIVDHPFFFVIRDKRASNSILFMGRVVEPTI